MEPADIFIEDTVPVIILRDGGRDGGVLPVIHDLGRALGSAALSIYDADTLAAVDNLTGADIVFSHACRGALGYRVIGQAGDKLRVHAEAGEGHEHVRLRAGVVELHGIGLKKAEISRRCKAYQHIPEAYDLFHAVLPHFPTTCSAKPPTSSAR